MALQSGWHEGTEHAGFGVHPPLTTCQKHHRPIAFVAVSAVLDFSMATVLNPSPNHWVVHLASRSDADSEVTVELRMSKATADNLARLVTAQMAELNSDTSCSIEESVGSAVLTVVSSAAAIARVKERASASDQQEIIDFIEDEVSAARAGRP